MRRHQCDVFMEGGPAERIGGTGLLFAFRGLKTCGANGFGTSADSGDRQTVLVRFLVAHGGIYNILQEGAVWNIGGNLSSSDGSSVVTS